MHTKGAMSEILDLETALTGRKFKYRGSKYEPPFANVKYIKGTFAYKENVEGLQGGRKEGNAICSFC